MLRELVPVSVRLIPRTRAVTSRQCAEDIADCEDTEEERAVLGEIVDGALVVDPMAS